MTGPINHDFGADPVRARALDARMHRELGLSLAYVCDASRSTIDFDEARMTHVIDRLKAGQPVAPAIFARYYELVIAIGEDAFDDAAALFDQIGAAAPAPDAMQIFDLDGPELGDESARYLRMMNADASLDLGFKPPEPDAALAFRTRLAEGTDLLDRVVPELLGEIQAIVRQIVIAGSDPTKSMQFDGGSHYQLWGALFLNANFHPDPIAVAEVLAHESGHSLLFGFCTDEPLVTNADDELFASPLRTDLRPMDGIYHATFVSARMHWTMSRLARSPLLTAAERERAHEAAMADLRNFDSGHQVVTEHGALTPLGVGLMAGASGYMDTVR